MAGFENNLPIPSGPNAANNVTCKSENAEANEFWDQFTVDKSTTPIGIANKVVAIIPIKIAPRTFLITNNTVINNPINANNASLWVKFTNEGTTPPLEVTEKIPPLKASVVAWNGWLLIVVIVLASVKKLNKFAFFNPIYATNTPIPPPIACCILTGIAWIIILRIFVTVMKIFNNPQINTIANASCQEKPKPNTTVNVKNAFNPIPGANA